MFVVVPTDTDEDPLSQRCAVEGSAEALAAAKERGAAAFIAYEKEKAKAAAKVAERKQVKNIHIYMIPPPSAGVCADS